MCNVGENLTPSWSHRKLLDETRRSTALLRVEEKTLLQTAANQRFLVRTSCKHERSLQFPTKPRFETNLLQKVFSPLPRAQSKGSSPATLIKRFQSPHSHGKVFAHVAHLGFIDLWFLAFILSSVPRYPNFRKKSRL